MFIGNDINDKAAMEIIGWAICPNDAHDKIKKISKIFLKKCGGDGVVRELLDLIIDKGDVIK